MAKYFPLLGIMIIIFPALSSCAGGGQNSYSPVPLYESYELNRSSESPPDVRMVAYTVSMELIVKNVEKTRADLLGKMKDADGFLVRESDHFITARIPSENMDAFISHAKTLGKIENESKTGVDITDQYKDNVIRLESMMNVRSRYLALLDHAKEVDDIINIEKELERIDTEIEMLEGKIKHAELSVAYSNITVRFKEKVKPGPIGWIFYGLYQGVKWLFVW